MVAFNIDNELMDAKSYQLKIKSFMLLYYILTILKYVIFSYKVSISYTDFFFDFVIVSILLYVGIRLINYFNKGDE